MRGKNKAAGFLVYSSFYVGELENEVECYVYTTNNLLWYNYSHKTCTIHSNGVEMIPWLFSKVFVLFVFKIKKVKTKTSLRNLQAEGSKLISYYWKIISAIKFILAGLVCRDMVLLGKLIDKKVSKMLQCREDILLN